MGASHACGRPLSLFSIAGAKLVSCGLCVWCLLCCAAAAATDSMCISFSTLEGRDLESYFSPGHFPKEIVSRGEMFKEEVYTTLLRPENGDPQPHEFIPSASFAFIIFTEADHVPGELLPWFNVIRIGGKAAGARKQRSGGAEEEDAEGAALADAIGLKEKIRNSTDLVEAAFDGETEEVKTWLEKGYSVDSMDGRKHTALSEAACQGHTELVKFLLDRGADPNKVSDTGRSAIFRACFHGHHGTVQLLLEAGGDPQVCANPPSRLVHWSLCLCAHVMAVHKRGILLNSSSCSRPRSPHSPRMRTADTERQRRAVRCCEERRDAGRTGAVEPGRHRNTEGGPQGEDSKGAGEAA